MTVSVVSLLVPEEVMFSLFVPEELTFSLISLLAESAPEAAAVGPRGDQAVVGGGGYCSSPLCQSFDFFGQTFQAAIAPHASYRNPKI